MRQIRFLYFETLPSTSGWVKERLNLLKSDELLCVVAATQTEGRGRFDRTWLSASGENLYLTLGFSLPSPCSFLGNLGQIASLSCVQLLKGKGVEALIKWPNDLLIRGKKVGGVLCETVPFPGEIRVALGIGLNVDLPQSLLNTVQQKATSLCLEYPREWKREELLGPLVKLFSEHLTQLEQEGFAPFHSEYVKALAFKEGKITHTTSQGSRVGTFEAIDPQGQLVLRLEDGTRVSLSAGEVYSFDQPSP